MAEGETGTDVEAFKKSKYSGAIAKEIRRAALWQDVNRHSRDGKYSKWNEDLDCIWSELCVDVKEDEFDEKQTAFNKFDIEIAKLGTFKDNITKDNFKITDKDYFPNRNNQYKKLREKEIFLRRLENELGKGTAWEDSEEDEF